MTPCAYAFIRDSAGRGLKDAWNPEAGRECREQEDELEMVLTGQTWLIGRSRRKRGVNLGDHGHSTGCEVI